MTIEIPAVWRARTTRWESPDGRFYFDPEAADRACDFFPTLLTHHMGEFEGQPFVLRDDQALLLTRPIFGWKHTNDGLRRFRKVFAFCPKGWGKSPWGAGTGIYLARCDGEAAAEVYAVAGDREQARIVHENAKVMVEQSDLLSEGCEIVKNAIYWAETRSVYKVLSSDASTKHGFRPHGVIFDELHAQRNRELYEALIKSMVKRRQPVMIIITHAGDDDESICYEEYEYAKGVLSERIPDETCLPVLFEAKPEDDWTDPDVWERVNPGHGITVKHDGIATECIAAQAEPRKLNDFLRYHLNRWVNDAVAWIPIDWWDACREPLPSDDVLARAPCAVGIDMAQKIDLTAVVVVFRLPLEGASYENESIEVVNVDEFGNVTRRTRSLNYRIAVLPYFWLPDETLRERAKQDHVPYDQWHAQGLLRVTDGAVVDAESIVRTFMSDAVQRFPLIKQGEIGYDPAHATELSIRLEALGFRKAEVLTNYKHLSEACHVFEALVKAGRVMHGGHRLLRQNLENTAVKRDEAGRIRPVRPKRSGKRIDGTVGILNALSRLIVQPDPEPPLEHVVEIW